MPRLTRYLKEGTLTLLNSDFIAHIIIFIKAA